MNRLSFHFLGFFTLIYVIEILITSSQYHYSSHEGCLHLFNKVISYNYDLSLSYHEFFYIQGLFFRPIVFQGVVILALLFLLEDTKPLYLVLNLYNSLSLPQSYLRPPFMSFVFYTYIITQTHLK